MQINQTLDIFGREMTPGFIIMNSSEYFAFIRLANQHSYDAMVVGVVIGAVVGVLAVCIAIRWYNGL